MSYMVMSRYRGIGNLGMKCNNNKNGNAIERKENGNQGREESFNFSGIFRPRPMWGHFEEYFTEYCSKEFKVRNIIKN